MNLGGINTAIW